MSDQKPTITLQPNDLLTIQEISEQVEVPMDGVERELKEMIGRHYRYFGTKPLQIEHDPAAGGNILTPSSVIGQLNGDNFILRIDSKIPGLSVGKCLGLAQKSGYSKFSKYRGEMERQDLSEKEQYNTIDYFAISFLSVVSNLIQNGLNNKFTQETEETTEFTGQIDIEQSIKRGSINHSPVVRSSEVDSDTDPNRLIKTAIGICKNDVSSQDVAGWAASLYPHFESVEELDEVYDGDIVVNLSVPREDYELAVELAGIILNGSAASLGEVEAFLPFFTLNLNELFEFYVQFETKNVLNLDRYAVNYNGERDHDIQPELTSKNIRPDLVVQGDSGSIVLDMKNKYDCVENTNIFRVRNEDIYQLSYYRHSIDGSFAFLIYPGGEDQASQYAIKKSESNYDYKRRRKRRFDTLVEENMYRIFPGQNHEMALFKWVVDMSGTIDNTKTNIAHLSQLLADLIQNVHDESDRN
jgi:hypothetical protein